ncbi:MAG: DUF4058 family protein [Pirellulales bacterium]
MASPFPGMDPYLEDAALWPGFHHRLISAAAELLQPQLKSRGYFVDIDERVWLLEPQRSVYPDMAVYNRPKREAPAGLAVAEADEPVRIRRKQVEVREAFLQIYDTKGNRLVTGIEFVSPSNKTDPKGRELYERKRQEMEDAGVNLVEIDLLRSGPHLLKVPAALLAGLKPWNYLVGIVRPNQPEYEVYPIPLRNQLPRIRVPLKPDDSDAVLDLQQVFERAYDTGPYPDRLDYSADPAVPLTGDDAAWAEEQLVAKGLRPPAE